MDPSLGLLYTQICLIQPTFNYLQVMLIAIWLTVLCCKRHFPVVNTQLRHRQTDRHMHIHTEMGSDHLFALGLSLDHFHGCQLPLVGHRQTALVLQQNLEALGVGIVGSNVEWCLQGEEYGPRAKGITLVGTDPYPTCRTTQPPLACIRIATCFRSAADESLLGSPADRRRKTMRQGTSAEGLPLRRARTSLPQQVLQRKV